MSKESRLAAKARSKQAARKRTTRKIVKVAMCILIPILVLFIGFQIFMSNVKKNVNASTFVKDSGKLFGLSAKSYVTLCDYKNINLKRDDYLPTVSELQSEIDSALDSVKETVKEKDTAIKADSTVYLNYKITVDGKELTDKEGKEKAYKLGNKTFTEAFDKAIAALKVGGTFDIEISFPEDHSDSALKGKKAKIAGDIVSVVVVPELTDKLVADKFADDMKDSDYPKTVQGYKDFLANAMYDQKLRSGVSSYIIENSKVKSYPYLFTKAQYYMRDAYYNNMVNYWNQMYGQQVVSEPKDLIGVKTNSEYKKRLKEEARNYAKSDLIIQAIHEDANLKAINQADVEKYVIENTEQKYSDLVKSEGYPALAQTVLQVNAFEYVMSLVKVEGDTSKMTVPDPEKKEESK